MAIKCSVGFHNPLSQICSDSWMCIGEEREVVFEEGGFTMDYGKAGGSEDIDKKTIIKGNIRI